MQSVKYVFPGDSIMLCVGFYVLYWFLRNHGCFSFQSVKYWKTGSLEQRVNLVNVTAREIQTLPRFFYSPRKQQAENQSIYAKSHK